MRRRDFIQGIAVSSAWPLAARAQKPPMPVIGFLSGRSPSGGRLCGRSIPFGPQRKRVRRGSKCSDRYRWAEGQYDRLPV